GARAFLPAPSRSKFGRRVCVIEARPRSVIGLNAAEDGRAPDRRWVFPTRAGARAFLAAPAGQSSVVGFA
ncbi:MAG TPA: hypothetical protein PLW35_05735, partial [Verrucomicrobiota bacterium]|nr:hypothetical protein [Verrucomicrobiota bacterium]